MGSFMRIISASKDIGYCSSLSIVVSSKACSLGSLFKFCSSFSTLLLVKDFILSSTSKVVNWVGFN